MTPSPKTHVRTNSSPSDLTIKDHTYSLDDECPIPWSSGQTESICVDYPFQESSTLTPEDYIFKLYLQTLWLPDSIMPLHFFVKALRRVAFSQATHLHSAMQPLLLSVRATQDKYHQELPQILQDGGGAGELEESMMWYAYTSEGYDQTGATDKEPKELGDKAQSEWMTRLERREVMIQILLYLHIISLPKPPENTLPPAQSSPNKRKRKHTHGPPTPAKPLFPPTLFTEQAMASPTAKLPTVEFSSEDTDISLEDRAEFFMDKLSVWQLVSSLDEHGSSQPPSTSQSSKRDWMQTFCEEVVEPLFHDKLPHLCDLLRSKIFPHSPFSDDESDPAPRISIRTRKPKAKERIIKSPLRSEEVEKKPKGSRAPSTQATTASNASASQRHRSRSISVSISSEEVRAKGASRGGVASSKVLFREEIEMKRSLSKGNKLFPPTTSAGVRNLSRQPSSQNNVFTAYVSTLTSNNCSMLPPANAVGLRTNTSTTEPKTLVADTPIKRKSIKTEPPQDSPDPILLGNQTQSNSNKFDWTPVGSRGRPGAGQESEDEEEPRLLLPLRGHTGSRNWKTDSQTLVKDTPVKKRKISE